MVWRNPYVDPNEPPSFRVPRDVESVRLATVQLQARPVKDFAEFIHNIEYFVDVASNYSADFVVFPELFTLSLLSFEPEKLSATDAIEDRQSVVSGKSVSGRGVLGGSRYNKKQND